MAWLWYGYGNKRRICKWLFESNHYSRSVEETQEAIAMTKNPILLKRTRHIYIKFHYIREKIQDKTIELNPCILFLYHMYLVIIQPF